MNIRETTIVIIFILLGCMLLLMSGCTTIRKGDFSYTSTIFDKKIDNLAVIIDPSTGKVSMVEMKNYNSNADYVVEALKAVAK